MFCSPDQSADQGLDFLGGGGEIGARMRALNWYDPPLGPPQSWPQSLKFGARIVINSPFPIFIWWSTDLCYLYNDDHINFLGGKLSPVLGLPAEAADARLVVTAWYRAAETIFGWTPAEVLGRDIREIVRSDLGEQRQEEAFPLLAKTGYVYAYQDIIQRNHAEEALRLAHTVLENTVVERTHELVKRNQELVEEIANREQAEEALRESEARFRALFAYSPDSILLLDPYQPGWPIVDANEAAARLHWTTRGEIIGQSTYVHSSTGNHHSDETSLDRLRHSGPVYGLDEHRRKDGSTWDWTMRCACWPRSSQQPATSCRRAQGRI